MLEYFGANLPLAVRFIFGVVAVLAVIAAPPKPARGRTAS